MLRTVYMALLVLCLTLAIYGLISILRGSLLFRREQTSPWRQLLDWAGLSGIDRVHQRAGRAYLRAGGKLLQSVVLVAAGAWFAGRLGSALDIPSPFVKAIQRVCYVGCAFGVVTSLFVSGVGLIHLLAARLPPSGREPSRRV